MPPLGERLPQFGGQGGLLGFEQHFAGLAIDDVGDAYAPSRSARAARTCEIWSL